MGITPRPATLQHPFRWIVLAGASLLYFCFSALMAVMAVLVLPISTELQLNPFHIGTILAAWQLIYLIASIPAGSLIDKYGLRPCLLLAALIMCCSVAMRMLAEGYASLLIAMLVFGLSGPLITVGAPKLVGRWFDDVQQGTAMGIFMNSAGIGALLATVLTNSFLMPMFDNEWRSVLGAYTALAIITMLIWLAIINHPAVKQLNDKASHGPSNNFRSLRSLVASSHVRFILLMAITMFFFVHTTYAWIPEVLRARGLNPAMAGFWAGVPAFVSIVTGLIVPRLARPERRFRILAAIATIGLVSAIALDVESAFVLFICLAGIGLPLNTLVPIAMLMLLEHRGSDDEALGLAGGLFFAVGQIGGVLGPLTSGLAINTSNNYDAPLWLLSAAMLLLLILLGVFRSSLKQQTDHRIRN